MRFIREQFKILRVRSRCRSRVALELCITEQKLFKQTGAVNNFKLIFGDTATRVSNNKLQTRHLWSKQVPTVLNEIEFSGYRVSTEDLEDQRYYPNRQRQFDSSVS